MFGLGEFRFKGVIYEGFCKFGTTCYVRFKADSRMEGFQFRGVSLYI